MAVESHAVTPEHHEAVKAGTEEYYEGAEKSATEEPTAEAPKEEEAAEAAADDTTEEAPAEEKAEETPTPERELADLDYDSYYKEFASNGNLSDESRAAILEKLPIPPEALDVYLAGLQAQRMVAEQAAFNLVGGKDNYTSLVKWGAENLSEGEIAEYNAALDRGGDSAKFAIEGLSARMAKAGNAPSREASLVHGSTPGQGEPLLKSRAELRKLIADPRFEKDPAFRKKVEQQLERSLQSPDYRTW